MQTHENREACCLAWNLKVLLVSLIFSREPQMFLPEMLDLEGQLQFFLSNFQSLWLSPFQSLLGNHLEDRPLHQHHLEPHKFGSSLHGSLEKCQYYENLPEIGGEVEIVERSEAVIMSNISMVIQKYARILLSNFWKVSYGNMMKTANWLVTKKLWMIENFPLKISQEFSPSPHFPPVWPLQSPRHY